MHLDRKRFTMVFICTGLWWQEQEGNQVCHLLDRHFGFQAFWHQRKAGARKRRDVAAERRRR